MENKKVNAFLNTLTEEQRTALLACKTEEEVEKVIDDYDIDLPDEMLADVAGGKGIIPAVLAAVMMLTSGASIAANASLANATQFNENSVITEIGEIRDVELSMIEDAEPAVAGRSNSANKGNVEVNDYLKSIAPEDKETLLVQEGDSSKLDTKPTTSQEGSDFVVVTRKLESLENSNADLFTIEGTVGGIYPGAIVHADSKLVDGRPDILPIEGEDRQPLPVYLDIANNTLSSQSVDGVSFGEVNSEINKMLENWFGGSKTAAAKATYKSVMVHSEKQLDLALGVKGAADKYGVDVKACMNGQKQEMLVIFNQIYYTVRTPQTTAAKLFAASVTPADLQYVGVNASNPALAEVTSMSYGRQIVVKLSTNSTSANVEASWNAAIGATKIDGSAGYKEVMDSTSYSVCAYGGNPSTVGKIMKTSSLSEINDALTADLQFTVDTPAVPLSYSTTFIDDATNATVNRTTKYVSVTRQVRKPITFEVDAASLWSEKSQCLYGRKIIGVNEDGSFQLGPWKEICSDKGNVTKTNISGEYAEFGFEVDIKGGTDWPYSDVFWNAGNGVVDTIKIDTGGTCRMANIKIEVNGNKVYEKSNCDSHNRYNWS